MANDKNCVILSELAYLDLKKYKDTKLYDVFYSKDPVSNKYVINKFSNDTKLQEFADKLVKYPDFYKKT